MPGFRDHNRHSRAAHCARESVPSTLGVEAAIKGAGGRKCQADRCDLIICATSTPEYIFPATACLIQDQLGASKAGAFDLLAACSGFIFGVNMAAQAIRSVRSKRHCDRLRDPFAFRGLEGPQYVHPVRRRRGRLRLAGQRPARRGLIGGDALGRFRRRFAFIAGRRKPSSRHRGHVRREHYIQMDGAKVFRSQPVPWEVPPRSSGTGRHDHG